MATYKLMQDIEAEDHILGPLSLRQFIYALVAAFLYYMCFLLVTRRVAFLLILFVPPALFFTFFAFPFGRDQSTEIWALAKLRFLFKPRRRIWDQSGVKELVKITAPKKVERVLTNGLSEVEVKSRLSALANTIDSRGWAVKNVNVNAYTQPDPFALQSSDRLINLSSIPQEVPNYDIQASDDILDETSNPIAQQFEHLITASAQAHRQHIIDELNSPVEQAVPTQTNSAAPADYWFMSDTPDPTTAQASLPTPAAAPSTPDEEALAAQIRARNDSQQASYAHLRTLQPLGSDDNTSNQETSAAAQQPSTDLTPPQPSTPPTDPAILSLASNNDLNVATLARQARRFKDDPPEAPQDEVVISLR
jgi:hypothetical protein